MAAQISKRNHRMLPVQKTLSKNNLFTLCICVACIMLNKPAFPMEKALSIIEDCKGAQFDPKCVEAFMDSLPEVQEVLGKYMEEM